MQRVAFEADARQRRQVLDRAAAIAAAQRQLGVEVPFDQGLHPGVDEPQAERDAIDATRVEPIRALRRVRVAQQALVVKVLGDLQVQRGVGDAGGLDKPFQSLVNGARISAQVLERRLVAERLEVQHRGVHAAERVVRPRGDDERQVLALRVGDRESDEVVAILI